MSSEDQKAVPTTSPVMPSAKRRVGWKAIGAVALLLVILFVGVPKVLHGFHG